jgi:IclR family mhp operon transcriptional activator
VAQEIRLPRTTAYRILETLSNAGFVLRDPADDRYRLTRRVKDLSRGFVDDPWVTEVATPCMVELCNEIVWPVSIATLSGLVMMLRKTTDHVTPLTLDRFSAGIRVPLLTSSAGRAYLAACPAAQCDTLLDQLSRSSKEEDKLARSPRPDVMRILADIRSQGYATVPRTRRMVEEISMSAPVMSGERAMAALTVRFSSSAVPLKTAIDRFLPKLQRCAGMIGAGLLEQSAGVVPTP